jgi:catechol 2,3-dioxygenase-like lactoylglutathione lyase family enzyme
VSCSWTMRATRIGAAGKLPRNDEESLRRKYSRLLDLTRHHLSSILERRTVELQEEAAELEALCVAQYEEPMPCYTRSMNIKGLHHVQLAMPPGTEVEATAFYEAVLGVPRVLKPPHLEARGGCWFESDDVRIHLGVEGDFQPARKAHPAFLVRDISELREHLESAGVQTVDDQPLPGYDRFYTFDPFGNRLEFLCSLS